MILENPDYYKVAELFWEPCDHHKELWRFRDSLKIWSGGAYDDEPQSIWTVRSIVQGPLNWKMSRY